MTLRRDGRGRPEPREPRTLIKDASERLLGRAAVAPVELFIMGPSVNANVADADLEAAARLRKALLLRVWNHDHYAVNPDLQEVFELVDENWDRRPDLCTIELEYARAAMVLVFIHASNGSAAEVGFFSGFADMSEKDRTIGEKSLILFDQAFEDDPGFVALGPAALLAEKGARVAHIDYSDHDAAWAEVETMIDRARAAAARRGPFR